MPEYRCITKCFHTVSVGPGGALKHKFFREGDLLTVPEGTEVPHHFVPVAQYKDPDANAPRSSDESAQRYSKRQFPPLIAPTDDKKRRRQVKAAALEGKSHRAQEGDY